MNHLPKAILLCGPTASGKTNIALFLAKHLNAEIINLDSVQIYKELNIGSAKPSPTETSQIPHHLINITSINNPLSSYDIFKLSLSTIRKILDNKKQVIITGGTGLYYKSLLYGMFEGPAQDISFRENLKKIPLPVLYEQLTQIDPKAAEKIHPHDYKRIERALEVYEKTKTPLTDLQKENLYTPPCDFLLLGISFEREILYERINKRVDFMIYTGLLEEVQNLYKKYPDSLLLKQTIGYKEIIAYLENKTDLETATQLIKQNSRHFAKRQLTLFRNLTGITWFTPPDEEEILNYINLVL